MEFEDILEEVGSYGTFQRNLVFGFAAPVSVLAPFFSMALIFMVTVPNHWCHVPEVASSNLSLSQQRNLVEGSQDPNCLMHQLNYSEFLAGGYETVPNDTEEISCRNSWEYDKTDFEATAATKWNMVCANSHYPSLILTLQNVGSLVGTPIYGSMADRLGRKITLFLSVFITLMTEVLSILTSNFAFFAILKTISGAAMPTVVTMPYILISELVRPNKRVAGGGIINCCWVIGMCAVSAAAYLSRNWITLTIVNVLAGVIVLSYWKFVPESPIWLISKERYEDALDIMMRIGKKNKRPPDESILFKKLKLLGEKIKKKKVEDKQDFCIYITKYPRLRKIFLIITFCWIANLTAYLGLQYNVTNLEGNEFLNFFLLSIVEAPGNILFWILMEQVGRRWTASIGFVITGLVCMAPVTGLPYCETISSVLGKLIISGVFMVTDQQACELYPTVCRSFGMGISKTICKITTLFVPYLIYLGMYGKAIPFVVISLLCILSGILAAFLPESLDENLPQNISDAEEFGKDQKFFSFNRKKQALEDSPNSPTENDVAHQAELVISKEVSCHL